MMREFVQLRSAAGLTLEQVATEFGKPLNEVAAWDAGLGTPPVEVVRTLTVLSAYAGKVLPSIERTRFGNLAHNYRAAVSTEHRKRFGQVFTPEPVADLMADWVLQPHTQTVLDPALGTGVLTRACLKRKHVQITGVEADGVILNYLDQDLRQSIEVIEDNALTRQFDREYDAIIMNPPYIRHRELKEHDATREAISAESGCAVPKSANLYVDFVLKASTLLREGGRGAFLIPAEWMSANFSASLKAFLLKTGLLQALVTFSNCSQVFDGVLTTASLLLVEKGASPGAIRSHFLQAVGAADAPRTLDELARRFPPRTIAAATLLALPKWEPSLRGDSLNVPAGWTTLDQLARPQRGIATGCNSFFLVDRETVERHGISAAHAHSCIGRANDAQGLIFTAEDFATLDRNRSRVWLLDFAGPLSLSELAYVRQGEDAGLRNRYLLKTRFPWYSMEKRDAAPIWAGVFGRGGLRFVYNAVGAKSLTNFHCLYPKFPGVVFARALVALLNSTQVRERMVGHQRGYGGGLIKFEPNDLKAVPLPDIRVAPGPILEELAVILDQMDEAQRGKGGSLEIDGLISRLLAHS